MRKQDIEKELACLPNLDDLDLIYKAIDDITDSENKIIMTKDKMDTVFYCTKCGQETIVPTIFASDFKKGEKMTCGHCQSRNSIIYKNNRIRPFEKYITYFEVNERKELILRIFNFLKEYSKAERKFSIRILEVSRINVDHSVAMKNHSYRVMGSMHVHHALIKDGWKKDRTSFCTTYPLNETCQSIKRIKQIMKKTTNFKYSCLDYAIKNKFELLTFIDLYMKFPKIELLIKNGCKRLIYQMCGSYYINERMIKSGFLNNLKPKELKFLCENDLQYSELKMLRQLGIFDYDLIRKATMVNYVPENNANHRKIIEYLNKKAYRYSDYKDYISWCRELGKDMNDKRIVYPNDPRTAHDETYEEKILFENQVFNEKIHEYAIEMNKYTYSNKKLIIRPAVSSDELVNESKVLNHCVRTYASKMAERKTCIFVIRTLEEQEKPYVTLELKDTEIMQCRAANNARPNDEVLKFVRDWGMINKLNLSYL